MAACLVQALGCSAIALSPGQYKTAKQILDDFRGLVREASINSDFLVQGVDNPSEHREDILDQTAAFRRLLPCRAGGLHAGRGLLHEATVVQANLVSDFLELLGKSSRIRPYVAVIPRCHWYADDRVLMVEDIHRRLQQATGDDQATALASLYLVLPDITTEEPSWLQALERVSITPQERDIVYLMNVVEAAVPADLRRVGGAGHILPVAVRQHDPNAMPISPQYLRRQFSEIAELWHADIATANGRLGSGSLDLPPVEAVREVFALGLERSGVIGEKENFSAHQSWVQIVGSLAARGTPGPYWFLVRRTPDLGQLLAQLKRASQCSPSEFLPTRIAECRHGIEAIRDRRQLPGDDHYFGAIVREAAEAESHRARLATAQERNRQSQRGLPQRYATRLSEVYEGGDPVGTLLKDLLDDEQVALECVKFWAGQLARCAMDRDDLISMVTILGRQDLLQAHTDARKAVRRIDFRLHGPSVAQSVPPS